MKTEVIYVGNVPVKLFTGENASRSVLAVHGFGGNKDSLAIEGLAERLCGEGFRVAAPDLPCHGERTEPERMLTPERCLSDILAVENRLREQGGEVSAFGTSFGACLLLKRMELYGNLFRRVVLRVPAVEMAGSMLRCIRLFQPDFTLEDAKKDGFRVKMSKELVLPYEFYKRLTELNEVRHCDIWDSPDVLAIYSGRDELVARADTEEFLRLNPRIQRLCIEESGHRMLRPEHLAVALDRAAEHILLQ